MTNRKNELFRLAVELSQDKHAAPVRLGALRLAAEVAGYTGKAVFGRKMKSLRREAKVDLKLLAQKAGKPNGHPEQTVS